MDTLCYLCFIHIFVMLSSLLLAALLAHAGKALTSLLSCVFCFLVCLSLSIMIFWVRDGA